MAVTINVEAIASSIFEWLSMFKYLSYSSRTIREGSDLEPIRGKDWQNDWPNGRNARKSLTLAIALLALSGNGCRWTGSFFEKKEPLLFSGTVEQQETRVGSKVGGRVVEVLVREGEKVEAGQPIVKFDVSELAALLAQAEARAEQQSLRLTKLARGSRREEKAQAKAAAESLRATLDAVRNWPRQEETAQARSSVLAAEADRDNLRVVFQRLQKLRETGDVSQQEFDGARYRLEQSLERVEIEKRRLELLLHGSRPEEIRAAEERYRQAQEAERLVIAGPRSEEIADARAQLAEARARVDQIRIQMNEGTVVAPARSIIELLPVRPGDLLAPGQVVARLLEEGRVWVRIYVPEPRLGEVKVGQQVLIRIDTFPDRSFRGSIEQINSQGEFTPRNIQSRDERNHQVFGVKIQIEDSSGVIKSGMAAEVTIGQGAPIVSLGPSPSRQPPITRSTLETRLN